MQNPFPAKIVSHQSQLQPSLKTVIDMLVLNVCLSLDRSYNQTDGFP